MPNSIEVRLMLWVPGVQAAYSLDYLTWGFGNNASEAIANLLGTRSRHPLEWPDNASASYAIASVFERKTRETIAKLQKEAQCPPK